ncbi:MAG: RdgB/HAM1 family non-canonical purine NTP pyrophosphatase [Planctomycetota bacterium]|nr:RdgB/HAM1 family non-canonical purine NTP pyrophosphatase [Planctomycetota bacterium]
MKLLVGTHNEKKGAELRRLLKGLPVTVLTLSELPEKIPGCEETGETFLENASAKAIYYASETGLLCVADDSGLCVDALNGEPGVKSARYAGPEQNDAANIALLLERMKGVPSEERDAHFVCAIALAKPGKLLFTVQGVCYGQITFEPRGDNGFGYDPVFVPHNRTQTFAEMKPEEKDKVSHRGRALLAFRDRFIHFVLNVKKHPTSD